MEFLWNLFYFVVALGILVTIHEYGHFWVARKLGVKVLTFSVGFGKPIWQRTAKDGVQYVIASIPLGGYVKMLDERETEVAESDLPYAFNRKSVWTRMAIVFAGPIANFLLAILLYWIMFVAGITGYNTKIGEIAPQSIAGQAGLAKGDKIVKVDGNDVVVLQDVVKSLVERIGETDHIVLEVERGSPGYRKTLNLPLKNWRVDNARPDVLKSLGIRHAIEDYFGVPVIGEVVTDGAAAAAGIMPGDRILKFDDETIDTWQSLVDKTEANANQRVLLQIERNGELQEISVVIGSQQKEGKQIGLLGVGQKPINREAYITTRKAGFTESFGLAITETGKMIGLTVKLFKKLVFGDLSPESLSGPFSIAKGAGGSAQLGLVHFISFIAMISVNLGFINLLPIPLLDGGHILYFSIEAIRGKPLSQKAQELGMQIGMMLVFALMATAIFNDIRLFAS